MYKSMSTSKNIRNQSAMQTINIVTETGPTGTTGPTGATGSPGSALYATSGVLAVTWDPNSDLIS